MSKTSNETQRNGRVAPAQWVSPTVRRIRAGDAENSIDRIQSDGYASFS